MHQIIHKPPNVNKGINKSINTHLLSRTNNVNKSERGNAENYTKREERGGGGGEESEVSNLRLPMIKRVLRACHPPAIHS